MITNETETELNETELELTPAEIANHHNNMMNLFNHLSAGASEVQTKSDITEAL